MRISKAVVATLFIMSCGAFVREAEACRVCTPFLHCITAPLGAKLCIEGPAGCAMLLQCIDGPVRYPELSEELTVWTLFDAVGAASSSLRSEAGELSTGEEARAMCGARAATAAIADMAVAYGGEFSASFVAAAGDGFALRRVVEGERVRLEVREVSGEQVGRLLASESLAERDQLTVPVRVEGHDRILVLQAANVRSSRGPSQIARLRGQLRAANPSLTLRDKPLLEARAQ
jgi:hypothetical protein